MAWRKQTEPAVAALDVTNALALNAQAEQELRRLVKTYDINTLGNDDARHHYLLTVAFHETQTVKEFIEMYRRFTCR